MKEGTLLRWVAVALSLFGASGCTDNFDVGTINPDSALSAAQGGNSGTGGSVGTGGGPGTGGTPGSGGALGTGGSTGSGGAGGTLTISDASPDVPATEPDSGGATDAPGAESGSLCSLPADPGPCKANFPRYWYNPATGNCESFGYGGCEGNGNRFDTLAACVSTCAPDPTTKPDGSGATEASGSPYDTSGDDSRWICSLPADVGPCDGVCTSYWYNLATGICERFGYGCCGGNANRFATLAACVSACAPEAPATQLMPCTTNQECPSDTTCCDGGNPSCGDTRLPAGDRANPGEFLVSADGLTVTDTITGLLWQRDGSGTRAGCSADGSLRCNFAEAQAYCGSLALAGVSGWRLPAWKELVTIADLTTDGSTSSIDQTAFPSTPGEGFWTSSPYVGSSSSESYVDFANGSLGNGGDRILRVRCVRGSRCYPTSRFVVLDGELVRDTLTGLVWQQKPAVSSLDGGPCMDWAEAQGTCSSLGSGFRLPTLKEWNSLLCPTGTSGPSIDKTAFPIAFQANSRFWTSSPYALPDAGSTGYASPYTGPAPGYARYVDFLSSGCASFGKLWGDMRLCFSARCVR
jgi:hypothetical protein